MECVIENKLDMFKVKLVKENYNNDPLSGAEFELYADAECTQLIGAGLVASDENGIFSPEGMTLMKNQTYYLQEIVPPNGYILNGEPISISLAADRITVVQKGRSYNAEPDADGVYEIIVYNTNGSSLPSTGGSGLTLIYALGALCVALSGAFWMAGRRRGRSYR